MNVMSVEAYRILCWLEHIHEFIEHTVHKTIVNLSLAESASPYKTTDQIELFMCTWCMKSVEFYFSYSKLTCS